MKRIVILAFTILTLVSTVACGNQADKATVSKVDTSPKSGSTQNKVDTKKAPPFGEAEIKQFLIDADTALMSTALPTDFNYACFNNVGTVHLKVAVEGKEADFRVVDEKYYSATVSSARLTSYFSNQMIDSMLIQAGRISYNGKIGIADTPRYRDFKLKNIFVPNQNMGIKILEDTEKKKVVEVDLIDKDTLQKSAKRTYTIEYGDNITGWRISARSDDPLKGKEPLKKETKESINVDYQGFLDLIMK